MGYVLSVTTFRLSPPFVQTITGTPANPVPQSQTLNYTSQNKITNFQPNGYDAAGNITYDLIHSYLYDAEGRVCAVSYFSGMTTAYMVYIYDAEGRRVAKGLNPTFSCTPATQGFLMQGTYVLGQSGELVSELDGSGGFLRSHVYANGRLLATYDNGTTLFAFNDWLGTKRIEANAQGDVVASCINLPFGDELMCHSDSLDGHHFTGQIHDSESGNDYFPARYFSNYTGRFLSPDWASNPQAVPYATYANPQSLNLYSYMRNNPLSGTDPDGHLPIINFLDPDWRRNFGRGLVALGRGAVEGLVNMMNMVQSDHALPASSQIPLIQPSSPAEAAGMVAGPMLVAPAMSITVSAAAPAALETESVMSTALIGMPSLQGFSGAETTMIQTSIEALQGAGYDTSGLSVLIRAEMPLGYSGMSLSGSPTGAALGEGAFASQDMLNHTLEEELLHLNQNLSSQSFGPGDAAAKEAEVDAVRKFREP